jgi:hypothetical protein
MTVGRVVNDVSEGSSVLIFRVSYSKVKALQPSETLEIIYQTIRRNISEVLISKRFILAVFSIIRIAANLVKHNSYLFFLFFIILQLVHQFTSNATII